MRILKLKGKTEEAVMKQIEKEYSSRATILSTQKEETTGRFKWLKTSPRTVVTIAIEDESNAPNCCQTVSAEALTEKQAPLVQDAIIQELTQIEQVVHKKSYEALLDLKTQIASLKDEIGQLRLGTSHARQKDQVSESESLEVASQEAKLCRCIKNKLMQLGIKESVCELLLASIHGEDSETIIRQLFEALENMLKAYEEKHMPQVVFFIGSTGVGKTTTLAKLTAQHVLENKEKVVLFTSDTYRIAAVEQLKTYADILGVDIEIIYDEQELPKYIEKWKHVDHILIDTAGRSHKNEQQVEELKGLMEQIEEKQVFLVVNANTSGKDIQRIVGTYQKTTDAFDMIVTKLDETDEIGNVVNISYYAQRPIAYITNGQNVPADIAAFDKQTYITELLGRLNDE